MMLNKIATLLILAATSSVAWDYRTIIEKWLKP